MNYLDSTLPPESVNYSRPQGEAGATSAAVKSCTIGCRLIDARDLDEVANLLTEGFPNPLPYWTAALAVLRSRPVPDGMPRYGYLLDNAGEMVGVLLAIAAVVPGDTAAGVRFNVSSWYVRPDFRAYASILVTRALRHPGVTYLNISAARHTWPILTTLGYKRFADGAFLAFPAMKPPWSGIRILAANQLGDAHYTVPGPDRDLLMDHARAGALALWCESKDGGSPFVFRARKIISRTLRCAQLVYCRDLKDFVRMAGPIGRFLLRRGMPFILIGANGKIPNLPGIYLRDRYPMFVRGDTHPRLGDLAYTEAGLFGL